MKKYALIMILLLSVYGCYAEKNESVKNSIKSAPGKSQVQHKNTESLSKKIITSSHNKTINPLESVEYFGGNKKSNISYNIKTKKMVYNIKSTGRKHTLRLSGLAGLININGETYYTRYNTESIKTKGCIYDSITKHIVISGENSCMVEMVIEIEDMPLNKNINMLEYVSDLGTVILKKHNKS